MQLKIEQWIIALRQFERIFYWFFW